MSTIKIPRTPPFKDYALVQTSSGLYACPGWYPLPQGTTRSDIELTDDIIIKTPKSSPELSERIKRIYEKYDALSSKGDKTYVVVNDNGNWSCSCPASNFRRGECKHIKSYK